MRLTPAEMKAVKALIEYMRKPGKVTKDHANDMPGYQDHDSFIRLADEAREDNQREIYRV